MSESHFSDLIRSGMAREGKGLRELCREADVDPSFLSKVLSGKRSPPSEEAPLRRLADALKIQPQKLIVSAGRIPEEWLLLMQDDGMFERVDRLCAGASFPQLPARRSNSEPERRDSFGEELL